MTTEDLLREAEARRAHLKQLLEEASPRDAASLSRELRLLDRHVLTLKRQVETERQQITDAEREMADLLDEPPPPPTWSDRPFAG